MKVFAVIPKRRARVSGFKHSGWRVVEDSTPLSSSVRDVDFILRIIDDGADGFLFEFNSVDGEFCADSSHDTLAKAFCLAADMFAVSPTDWSLKPSPNRS